MKNKFLIFLLSITLAYPGIFKYYDSIINTQVHHNYKLNGKKNILVSALKIEGINYNYAFEQHIISYLDHSLLIYGFNILNPFNTNNLNSELTNTNKTFIKNTSLATTIPVMLNEYINIKADLLVSKPSFFYQRNASYTFVINAYFENKLLYHSEYIFKASYNYADKNMQRHLNRNIKIFKNELFE